MNRFQFAIWAIVFATALRASGAGFNDEQHKIFDDILGGSLTLLKQDAEQHLNTMQEALREAHAGGRYSRDEAALAIRRQVSADAEKLKASIAKLAEEVTQRRSSARHPAVMVVLLSKEQTVSFEAYRWFRTVTEMVDLANASISREDPAAGKLFAAAIRTHETLQDTVGFSIQSIVTKFLSDQAITQ